MFRQILPLAFNGPGINSQTAIPIGQQRGVKLPVASKAHHQRRDTHWQGFIPVGMPGVPGLAISINNLTHQRLISDLR